MSKEPQIGEKKLGQENLSPQHLRIYDNISYVLTLGGASISIVAFTMGASIVPPSGALNLVQGTVAMVIGFTLCAVAMTLNGQAGHKYGIPFIVQARTTFGFGGTAIPGFIRAVPAIFWFGVQSWVGASAINVILDKVFGFNSIFLIFILFVLLQTALATMGFRGIKWLENIGTVFLIISLFLMFYILLKQFGAQIMENVVNIRGTWGIAFWGAVTTMIGNYNTIAINISDLARELNKETGAKKQFNLNWLGIVPMTAFMALIGLVGAGATGTWDPIEVIVNMMPDSPILIILLLFIAMAQVTTNVVNNVVPPAYVIMGTFKKVKFPLAVIIIGILSLFTFPWKILTVGVFQLFVQTYSAFLGPIFAVMVVDYYIVRKGELDVSLLYDENGPYKGINWQGVISIVIGAVFALIVVEISWLISLLPSALAYYLLTRYCPVSKGFLANSVFEAKTGK